MCGISGYSGSKKLSNKSICVLPELKKNKLPKFISGVCSDFIEKYKNIYD